MQVTVTSYQARIIRRSLKKTGQWIRRGQRRGELRDPEEGSQQLVAIESIIQEIERQLGEKRNVHE